MVADTEQALNVEYIAPWAKISYQLIDNSSNLANKTLSVQCPHGRVGDQMWVRETFSNVGESYKRYANLMNRKIETITRTYEEDIVYRASLGIARAEYLKWTPSIHMPRWASRITLEITEVRVERLQDISEEDAIAEGMQFSDYGKNHFNQQHNGWSWKKTIHHDECLSTARFAFKNLWNSIYDEENWDNNPWVWVIEFKRINND
ncbi:ASCH domain-containing protein [Xenorhabdus doucetiae]|uniref:hypothetical protein n=1 Tax=Xenorhabdus doucetiae TaxID=351671 RepID=UPI0038CD80E8